MVWEPAYVGIGSNLDDPARQVEWAIEELKKCNKIRDLAISSLYIGPPMGPGDQPDFINAACGFLTTMVAENLLAYLRSLEDRRGRQRTTHWGPRVLDLDLLIYDRLRVAGDHLTLPHPGVHERSFVLYPLTEIAPELMVPGRGRVSQLAAACGRQGLKRYADAGDSNA